MSKIYLIQARYEKNADDGISYYTSKRELAHAVQEAEQLGGCVQVYECVPVAHTVYVSEVSIEIGETQK